MLKVSVEVDFKKTNALLARLSGPQMRQATASALTDAAFEARAQVQAQMANNFDRVTPYIRRSVMVKPANAATLEASVEPRYMGGKGVDPQNVLRAEIFGGARKLKSSELKLQRAGILPPGFVTVPGDACPLDQYGNIKGAFLVQLIAYFQAFPSGQGYKANMTQRRKDKLAAKGFNENLYATTHGVRYFVAYGKLRSGKTSHLHPGIWSATGVHDATVKPVLMFVRQPSYKKRLDFFGKPVQAALAKFNPRFRYHMRTILGE